MLTKRPHPPDTAAELAQRLVEAVYRERVVQRFVDSYVVEHGRHALQVHASLYRDLLTLLQREALIAAAVYGLQAFTAEGVNGGRSARSPMLNKELRTFRRKFLAALGRQQNWTAGEALDFQNDVQMYEELAARNAVTRRKRKPFEAANHPFVDRCAFLLDSSFMEKARVAASRALTDLEELTDAVLANTLRKKNTTR